jgi:hypothetical protein
MKPNTNLRLTALSVWCALAVCPTAVLAANPRPHEEHGTIKSVDATAHTLVITDLKNHAEHKFQWNDQTKFSASGKTAMATDLKAGERVRLTYSQSGELPTIERARIMPAKPDKTAKS